MSDEHDHNHDHDHGPGPQAPAPVTPNAQEDAGSQALAEALKSSFGIVRVVMVVLVLVFIFSGFFKVEQNQRAVVLKFGKPSGVGNEVLKGPGLHFALPFPIDEVVKIPYSQLITVKSSVGWYNVTPEQEALGQDDNTPGPPQLNPAVDGYVITGDGNIVHTRATLIYRIEDPVQYRFEFNNASNAVRNALDNALIYSASRFTVDDMITRDIARFQDTVTAKVTQLVQQQNLGIVIESCQVESRPPKYLKGPFDGVLAAVLTRDKTRSEALAYENQALTKASATAASLTNNAQAQRVQLVESVKAEAERFKDLLPGYRANPTLFASILLTEKIGSVLTNVQDKFYIPERADGKTRELRLQLSREPEKPTQQQ